MEINFALAVPSRHSSCSESPERAFPRVRPVIPAALIASVQGTTVPTAVSAQTQVAVATAAHQGLGSGSTPGNAYGMQFTDGTTKDAPSGPSAWSPPV